MKGKRIAAIAAVAALFTVVVGLATGAIPGSGGVIQGCYLKVGGVLRVIDADSGQRCTRLEMPISWSQQGLQGPAGANGQDGQDGATGPEGPAGPAGTFSGTFESPNQQFSITVTDTGIELAGPASSIAIDGAGISIDGAGLVSINGTLIRLNGCNQLVNGLTTVCTG